MTNACCCTTTTSSQHFNSTPLLQPVEGGGGGATAAPPRLDEASSAHGPRPPSPPATRHLRLHMRRRTSEEMRVAGWGVVMWRRKSTGSKAFCFEPWYLCPVLERLIFWDGWSMLFTYTLFCTPIAIGGCFDCQVLLKFFGTSTLIVNIVNNASSKIRD